MRSLAYNTAHFLAGATVQPNQCHCAPASAVPFAPFQSPLSSSTCTFLSGQGAQHTLLQAFRGQCIYLKTL